MSLNIPPEYWNNSNEQSVNDVVLQQKGKLWRVVNTLLQVEMITSSKKRAQNLFDDHQKTNTYLLK